jgi:hypothetical protein
MVKMAKSRMAVRMCSVLEAQKTNITYLWDEGNDGASIAICEARDGLNGGGLGGKGVRRGEGVYELAAKGSALHLGGAIAALAGSVMLLL